MADRLSQYPIVPAAFNPGMLQQQQLAQAQQVDVQSVPVFPNQEHGRAWHQMQQQIQNSYSGQPTADTQSAQINQQMAEMLRNQGMARAQGQQQMGQQFGIPSQQMAQQPAFHDPAAAQRNQSQMPPKFPNMGMPNASQMQQVRAPLLQAFSTHNTGHLSRLDLMGLASGQQQPQNPTINFQNRMPQPPQMQSTASAQSNQSQPTQNDLFPPSSIAASDNIRRSPSHSTHPSGVITHQPPNLPNPQALPAGRRMMTFQELRDRVQHVQSAIAQREAMMAQLSSRRVGMSNADFAHQMATWSNEVKSLKVVQAKFIQAMGQIAPQQTMANPSGPSVNVGNLGGTGQSQQQQQASNNGLQWALSSQQQQQQEFANAQMGQTAPVPQSQSLNIQPSHSPPNPSNIIPSPSVAAPQLLPGQISTQVSPNVANQYPYPFSSHGNAQLRNDLIQQVPFQLPPPLDKASFDTAYGNYCQTKNIHPEPRLMSIESRPIDLHMLHVHVMNEGGFVKVSQKELWAVLGARMGFVQFPGSDSEPAKSGPGAAQQLAHVYKEYLHAFDNLYIQSVFESKKKLQASGVQPNGVQNTARAIANAHQMQALIAYAHVPAHELRSRGFTERIISWVEENREQLQNTAKMQHALRGGLLNLKPPPGQPITSQELDRATSNTSTPFPPQQNPPIPSALQHPPGPRPGSYIPPHQQGASIPHAGNNNADTQFARQPQGPSMIGMGQSLLARLPRLSPEQLQHAQTFIMKIKQEFTTRSMHNMTIKAVPDDQKMDFNRALDQLQRHVMDIEAKLPLFCILLKQEDLVRRLIAIILTLHQQRNLLNSPTPQYIIELPTLHAMIAQMQQANELFANAVGNVMKHQQQQATNAVAGQPGSGIAQQRLPIPHPQLSHPVTQPIPPPASRSTPMTPILPGKKKASTIQPGPPATSTGLAPTPSSAVVSTPTPPPAPSATTPIAHPQTPTHTTSSPQGSRSPRTKSTPKPKTVTPAKRKASKAQAPYELPPAPAPAPAPPAAPVSAKRPRDEETLAGTTALAADSPPKRIKTDPDAPTPTPTSDALVKKREEVENIKTEEDAAAYLEQMTELFKILPDGQAQGSLTSDILGALAAAILQGCGDVPDASGDATASSLGLDPGTNDPSSSAPPPTAPSQTAVTAAPVDEFVDYFDFSSFTALADDDNGSKAPTPELVSSSSTNPSPESATEGDAAGHPTNIDLKTEEFLEISDPTRLGPWKEIDGGESAYYQQADWKWDSPMPTLDQPWAIFTS